MTANRGVLLVGGMEFEGRRITTCQIEEAFGQSVPKPGPFALKCRPSDKVFTSLAERAIGKKPNVRAAGEALYEALAAHKEVKTVLSHTAGNATPSPIFVHIAAPDAENLPWEVLFDQDFIALNPPQRCLIARLAAAPVPAQPLNRIIAPELRLLIAVAAESVNGLDEWASIEGAIERGLEELALPVSLLVLVSEDEVKSAVEAAALRWRTAGRSCSVEVTYTGDTPTLLERIRTFLPNVIHFFCHGSAESTPHLELETRADRITAQRQSSISLGFDDLKRFAPMGSLWLIVLNCCHGGRGSAQLQSLAQQLVMAGAPAVVAMRETVEVLDATLFTSQFYPDLLTRFKAFFTLRSQLPNIPVPETTWLCAVHQARKHLSSQYERKAEDSLEWTYPVVYVNRNDLVLHPRLPKFDTLPESERIQLVTQLDILRALRSAIDPLVDPEAVQRRAQLDALIDEVQRKIAG